MNPPRARVDAVRSSLHSFLRSLAEPPTDTLVTDVDRLLQALSELQQISMQLHEVLGRHPERHEQAKPMLQQLLTERQGLVLRLGEALVELRLAGVRMVIEGTATTPLDEPVPPLPGLPTPLPASDVLREQAALAAAARAQEKAAAEAAQRALLSTLCDQIGPPSDLATSAAVANEIDALEHATSVEQMTRWPQLSKHLQRPWLAMLVARTRALKEQVVLSMSQREQLSQIILRYPSYAKGVQPGYVNGLQLVHQPERGSWSADAEHWWQFLRELATPRPSPEPAA